MLNKLISCCASIMVVGALLGLNNSHAARVIEVSKDLSFGQPVMNGSGSVAYFAFTDDFDDDDSLNGLLLKRDGGTVVSNFNNYVVIDGVSSLDLGNSGLLGFVAAHVVGGQVIAGAFKGASPGQPTQDDFGNYLPVFMRGGTIVAGRRGTFVDRDTAEEQIYCGRIKFTSNRLFACESPGKLGASKLYDQGRGAGGRGKLSENGQFAVNASTRLGMAPEFRLYKFNTDPDVLRFEEEGEYKDVVGSQFAGQTIRDWLVADSGATAVLTALTDGSNRTDLYRISAAGGVSRIAEDVSAFGLIGISNGGTVFYRSTTGIRTSADPAQQWVSTGDAIEDYVITSVQNFGTNGFSNGQLAATASLCHLDDRSDCYSAVIVLDGSTTPAPDPDPNDPPADLVVWKTSGTGSFNNPDSWDPATVPTSDQIALFAGNNNAVTVDFGSTVANTAQLRIEQGTTTFLSGGYQLNQGSVATPSFVLEAAAPGDVPVLFIDAGHQFSTTNATIRNSTNNATFPASLFLEDNLDNPPIRSRWDNLGRLTVDGLLAIGRSGGLVSDSLFIGSGVGSTGEVGVGTTRGCPDISIADFGETWIGYRGTGTLEILGESCTVELSANAVVGALAGSSGTVEVLGASWIPFFSGPPQSADRLITIGSAGAGVVNIVDGGAMAGDYLRIGQQTTGSGQLNIAGFNPALAARSIVEVSALLEVGGEGAGILRASDGARMTAGQLDIGGINGQVYIAGAPDPLIDVGTLDVAGTITVGHSGQGLADFADLALVRSSLGVIGELPGSVGRVTIREGASWELIGDLQVGNVNDGADPTACSGVELGLARGELELLGDGVLFDVAGQNLTVVGPDSRLAGTGKLIFVTTTLTNCATLAPGNSPGTLTLQGNLIINGAVLEIELDGLATGEFDVLNVDGDIDLRGASIVFSFGEHVPAQGDQIRFLTATGTITTDVTTQYEYVGAEPGFDFDVSPDGPDGLQFTAINDAFREQVFADGFE